MRRTFIFVMLLVAGVLIAVQAQTSRIGMNLGMPWYDYDPLKIFADALKQARGFIGYSASDPGNNNLTVATNANGWPLADAGIIMFHGAHNMSGTYRIWFTTQNPSVDARTVTVSYLWSTATAGNQVYDAATNTVHYDVAVSGDALKINFVNTQGGVKNVKFMRPLTVGGTVSYDTAVTFTTPAKNICSKFESLRFMQVCNALSSNMVVNWADRTLKGYCCQQSRSFGGTGSAGVAWEYLAQLCNETGTDMYACIPFLVSDDYVLQLAKLLKDRLDAQRNIYLEYSNELWNSMADYDLHRNHDSAVAEVGRGGSPLNFDGSTNEWVWAWRRAGKRTKEISDIFRSVFGNAAMMTRVRPLLMTQQADGQATLSQNLTMMLDYYNNAAHVATPHPPNYYFYGAGGSSYYSFGTDATTLDKIWTSATMDTGTWIRENLITDINLCATFGLKRIAYEGGTEFTAVNQTLSNAAWYDSRFTRAIIDHNNAWSRYGGDLNVYFTLTGWGYSDLVCSFINDVDTLNTPKMRGIDSLLASPRPEVVYGRLVPCSIDGDSAAARFVPLWDPPSACRPTEWYSYIFRVAQAGTYGVTVNYTSPATGELSILADGVPIGAPALVSGRHTTSKFTTALTPGLHGVIVRVTSLVSGRLSIDTVNISVESVTAVVDKVSPNTLHGHMIAGRDIFLTLKNGSCFQAKIYNLSGRMIRVLADGGRPAGKYRIMWDGRNERKENMPNGIYLVKVMLDNASYSGKMVLRR